MADKGEIKRLGQGKFSEERIEEFDPSPESKKRADIATKRRKKIDILCGKDYEKELFDFKKEDQEKDLTSRLNKLQIPLSQLHQ